MSPAPWNNDPLPAQDYTYTSTFRRRPSGPVSHGVVDPPLCPECKALDLDFFSPNCDGCKKELFKPEISVSHIFAILRIWVPQVQENIKFLIDEAFRLGAHPDDRDKLTDMTLLMYVCKSGALGVGNEDRSVTVAKELMDRNVDLEARCEWTDMSCIHYAAFFNASAVLACLLEKSPRSEVHSPSYVFENGTPLHIAAANLCVESARILLKYGAQISFTDDLGRRPIDCIAEPSVYKEVPESTELIKSLNILLSETKTQTTSKPSKHLTFKAKNNTYTEISKPIANKSDKLQIGDRVIFNTNKVGTLEYIGMPAFSSGLWGGIRCDEPEGKNDGSVNGVQYFKCPRNYGIFVLVNKITKSSSLDDKSVSNKNKIAHVGKVNLSHVSSRLLGGRDPLSESHEIKIGDKVQILQNEKPLLGSVKYIGSVSFAQNDDKWMGIELDDCKGTHNGTVQGVSYFNSKDNHGVFVSASSVKKIKLFSKVENGLHCSSFSSPSSAKPLIKSNSCHQSSLTHVNSNSDSRSHSLRMTPSNFPEWNFVGSLNYNKFVKTKRKFLDIGETVMCIKSKEMGIIKYIGHIDVSPGIWVGLELRNPIGKHDGVLNNKRYFHTKKNHGLIIQPKKISVHGINGDQLLKSESEYPY